MKPSDNKLITIKNEYKDQFINEFDFNVVIKFILEEDQENKLKEDIELTKKQVKLFLKILKTYKKKIPLAYILKREYFYNKYFKTDKNVFIPRQDSEAMIEDLLSNDLKDKNVVDICCGTGALGLSVKEAEKSIKLTLVDYYKKPLKLARLNAEGYNNVKIIKSNFINYLFETSDKINYAIINPPYIEVGDEDVSDMVKNNEPETALYAANEGMLYYQILFAALDEIFEIHPEIKIYCEFGFSQKSRIEELYDGKHKIKFKKDYQGNWRYFIIGV